MSNPDNYTIGWICAILTESVAAQRMLDEKHDPPEYIEPSDNNVYCLGRIGRHNIVIAMLPEGQYGISSATGVIKGMMSTFRKLRVCLMVGVGGGAPTATHDIRLGDVVVSSPRNGVGGVIQYDYGKSIQEQKFRMTGHLNQPPQLLLSALTAIKTQHELDGHQLNETINKIIEENPRQRLKYARPDSKTDRLYLSTVVHPVDNTLSCSDICGDDPALFDLRRERGEDKDNPAIHYGLIASANTLMEDAVARDTLAATNNVLCFEMEAAGLMNHFPCLVIRGICDYSDSHKNKEWQGYAAMTAAAYAKDLLHHIAPSKVEAEKRIVESLDNLEEIVCRIEQDTSTTRDTVEHIRHDGYLAKLREWLHPPDTSSNANHARDLRHEGTGQWLLNNTIFESWCSGSRRHLWLHGLSGSGKTVLSTTVLDHLTEINDRLVLSFFFDFSDESKQTVDGMLRSFAYQLYRSTDASRIALEALFEAHDQGDKKPNFSALWETVVEMLASNTKVSIVLDALDESAPRSKLLDWIEDLTCRSELTHVHLIYTSRREAEFVRLMPKLLGEENCLMLDQNATNADIRSYIAERLQNQREFKDKRLPPHLMEKILTKVGDGAEGMFRWAACQLDSLAKCRHNYAIEKALTCLPRDLDQTYKRMLESIAPEDEEDAMRLLQFLIHSRVPLRLVEAIEILATELTDTGDSFDVGRRLHDKTQILEYCPGLITIVKGQEEELHLSHFSVKEYLIQRDELLKLPLASISITRVCLAYLTDMDGELEIADVELAPTDYFGGDFGNVIPMHESYDIAIQNFPMAEYAAQTWPYFASISESSVETWKVIIAHVQSGAALKRSVTFGDPYFPEIYCRHRRRYSRSTLYYVCLWGLYKTAKQLLDQGAYLHVEGGECGNALEAASLKGHADIVKLLIEHGADVHAGRYQGNSALNAAAHRGHMDVIRVLLEAGAAARPATFPYLSALCAASFVGYTDIVKLMVKIGIWSAKNADDKAQIYYAVLHERSNIGHTRIVKLMLGVGANPDWKLKISLTLPYASYVGDVRVVKWLIEEGADVNTNLRRFGNAIQAASSNGHIEIMKLLLEHGADVNAVGSCGHALQRASGNGCIDAVRLLIEHGADINAFGTKGDALYQASVEGHIDVVKLLIENGAGIHTKAQYTVNALIEASGRGYTEIAKMLIERGVSVNARTWRQNNALEVASYMGNIEIVKLLIGKGSDVNMKGPNGNALEVASLRGFTDIIELLIENGAHVDGEEGHSGRWLDCVVI